MLITSVQHGTSLYMVDSGVDAPATLHAALRALQQANVMIETLVKISEVKL